MPKREEYDFSGIDVVPQPVVTPANPPLTFTGFHLHQLLYAVLTASIVWIVSEYGQKFF
jgi:hypothetical protein